MAQVQTINYNSQENYAPIGFKVNKHSKTVEIRHLERINGGLIIVSDGFKDIQKEINSELKNAGLQNILKLQELRYGTLDNAIARARDRGVYADVSHIPTDVAGQSDLVNKTNAAVDKLCKELGLTKEQLLGLTPEKYVEIKEAQAAAAAAAAAASQSIQGGNE